MVIFVEFNQKGLPFPQNFETAQQLESIIRQGGAIPATIAIFDGKIHIGI